MVGCMAYCMADVARLDVASSRGLPVGPPARAPADVCLDRCGLLRGASCRGLLWASGFWCMVDLLVGRVTC